MVKKMEYVTTVCDMWNSADELHFFVLKGQVKPLPEIISPVVEDAINQGLLKEPTQVEMENYEFEKGLEKAIKERKIKPGKSFDETAGIYQAYLNMKEEESKQENEIKTVAVIAPEIPVVMPNNTAQTNEYAKELEEKEKALQEKEEALKEKNKKIREREKRFKEQKAKQK